LKSQLPSRDPGQVLGGSCRRTSHPADKTRLINPPQIKSLAKSTLIALTNSESLTRNTHKKLSQTRSNFFFTRRLSRALFHLQEIGKYGRENYSK
jgi:hypothetical protein